MKAIINAKVVLPERIVSDGLILYEGGKIVYAGDKDGREGNAGAINARGAFVGPGFVDIHCHAGGDLWAFEDAVAVARHHLMGGTTSLLCTMYHDVPDERLFACAEEIRRAMRAGTPGNLAGIHMEGPYLSPKYGAHAHTARMPDPKEYMRYIEEFGDLILQWTYSPELDGADAFADAVHAAGITLAIGHSEASLEMVADAVGRGASICTHITDATGTFVDPPRYGGTKELSFDQAAMLHDELYCEVINDSLGAHVRPEMSRLILKTVGLSRMVGVTDAGAGGVDASDINIVNGEIYGSKLRMDNVARNFRNNTGLSVPEIFQVCATNPALAVKLGDVGTIEPGKRANFVFLDENAAMKAVVLDGQLVETQS